MPRTRHTTRPYRATVGVPERASDTLPGCTAVEQKRLTEAVDAIGVPTARRLELFGACHGQTRHRTKEALGRLYVQGWGCRLPRVEAGICTCLPCSWVRRRGGWVGRPITDEEVTEEHSMTRLPEPRNYREADSLEGMKVL